MKGVPVSRKLIPLQLAFLFQLNPIFFPKYILCWALIGVWRSFFVYFWNFRDAFFESVWSAEKVYLCNLLFPVFVKLLLPCNIGVFQTLSNKRSVRLGSIYFLRLSYVTMIELLPDYFVVVIIHRGNTPVNTF
jgi:hypothetical protein